MKNCLREIRNDRKHIRKKGEEYLKLKMDEYIKPEDFQIGETKTGRKGQRRNRPKVPTTVIVGSLSGNTRKAMAIIKDAISWGDKIEVASDDPMIQNWIGSMKSTGTFKPFSEYQKESNVQDQVSKGHIVSASKQVNDTAHVKIDKSHIPSAFSVSQIEDSWDDDDWFL